MTIKKKHLKIAFIIIAILAAVAAFMALLYLIAPYLLAVIIFPAWLVAALADGSKV